MSSVILFLLLYVVHLNGPVLPQGQPPIGPGIPQPIETIKNVLGGVYSKNVTLFFRNSPYRVMSDITVDVGVTMTIETGVQIYFDTGVGLRVKGALWAIGNEFAHIQLLPYQQQIRYDDQLPEFRLVDGPTVRQGRLQAKFRDRWRSVCTMLTNWTSIDTGTACRSMGYSDGGFWKWFRRNNDTYPFIVPKPDCHSSAKNLWECSGFSDQNKIRMSENLCQGEDDIGVYCWGPPSFTGWARHWKGLQIYNSPFHYVNSDPDMVSVHKESLTRLEYIDILYAGYDGQTKNATPAVWIEGVPPIMNGLRIEHSARDGMYLYEPSGPILIANSTFSHNRGHGIAIDNSTDGRAFINFTRIEGNYGDGVWYRQKIGTNLLNHGIRQKRDLDLYDEEPPRMDMCKTHALPPSLFFPHLISAHLANGTLSDPGLPPTCWMTVSLPPRLPYTYSLQFLSVANKNPPLTSTDLVVCDSTEDMTACALERLRIPLKDAIYPQSISIKSNGMPIFLSLDYQFDNREVGYVVGDVDVLFRVHASVLDKAYYGLNVTNCIIHNNTGNGIRTYDIRERTALTNVTVSQNEGYAGLMITDGAADVWLNDTRLIDNWGDGMNVSYAGGSITVNGTVLERNRWRGAAFHYNSSIPFYALHQEIIFKGRPSNNIFYLPTSVSGNEWGGILVGNFCIPTMRRIEPKVLINWVELMNNKYHPALEAFACQGHGMTRTVVDITGNRIEGNTGFGVRIAPAVNMFAVISSNQFLNNNDTALMVRNAGHPQLWTLNANVTISKNAFKFNKGKYIISIGMNEDAPGQKLIFNQQNEVRENIVYNPYPLLNPRTTPYAAMVVSSSNVVIHRNCFKNPGAQYEIAAELAEHAKWIDARENNWGSPSIPVFMKKIFDQFNRYSLASIEVDPFAAVCNQRNPHITLLQEYFREFRLDDSPFLLGGAIYENQDLPPGRYTVTDDLHVVPGAKLTIAPGSTLEFEDGVGMLVQGELLRTEFYGADKKVTFTSRPFTLTPNDHVRLVNEDGNDEVLEGRLEVFLDGEWGTVCNRSWTASHALMVCNQMGMIIDPQFFENWRIFPSKGDLPMIMDNVRCEENEVDITRCRHDGVRLNVAAGCRDTEVVGIRCAEPRWAGVRYSLLASPPTVTGQTTMNNWLIEKAGLFDFRVPEFSAALQIDWNYHTFHKLEIKNNYWNGLDIVYNDLTKKPAIRDSKFTNNRRNGIQLRSVGITIENVTVSNSGMAGIRYNSRLSGGLQNDIISWLELREQPELEANNVYIIPNSKYQRIQVFESQLNQRKFLMAKYTPECPEVLYNECVFEMDIEASGYEYGLASKMAIQIVNPVSNISDEDAIFIDQSTGKQFSARKDQVYFPIVSSGSTMKMRYTRSYGVPKLIVLVLFLDTQEYLDRFVHVYQSVIEDNQYAISSMHYSNLSYPDGTITNRWNNEKLWFQKVNFSRNSEAVVWINSPQHVVLPGTPLAEITYDLDNCSLVENAGAVIETHRDLFASANIFHWRLWSNTFANNSNSGMVFRLPDIYDMLAKQQHTFWMTENRFESNDNFRIYIGGYYAFMNVSSNNFTDNFAPTNFGLLEIAGMEKHLIVERNRFITNWGKWMLRIDITSHSLRNLQVPSWIQFNYFEHNHYIKTNADYVDSWPRSYAIGVFGAQKPRIHFNRLRNTLMDFELISGSRAQDYEERLNVTYNWWGTANDAEIMQRIFDFDDWNIYTIANFTPFYTSNELFLDFWWLNQHQQGQLGHSVYTNPSAQDLHGRLYVNTNLTLERERWYKFPHYYRPERPYRISRDLTIMPGATLTIERGVEVHVWPNVRILVLGELVADGTYWEPIRFKPINTTEYEQTIGKIGSRYKRSSRFSGMALLQNYRLRNRRSDVSMRIADWTRKKRADRARKDEVYRDFPSLYRFDPYYQRFTVSLTNNGSDPGRSGFLNIYNATTGEVIPSCDRQFTLRNAQVVCRELGYPTMNVYHWVTPRWDYDPRIRLVKTYMEPRECRGDEPRLDRCNLRLSGNTSEWQCMDNEHFNYIYCGRNRSLDKIYIGNWGGITFARGKLDHSEYKKDASVLRNVEIIGGGLGHNDTFKSAGLQLFYRSPVIDHLNVTNSSMHAIQIFGPREKVILNHVNVTDNKGQGISMVTMNVLSGNANEAVPKSMISIPYFAEGMLDICAAEKLVEIKNRITIYYKYDSFPLDCVKIFSSGGRKVSFRFLQVNLYSSPTDLGRSDALRIYNSISFLPSTLLAEFRTDREATPFGQAVSGDVLALHLRATAADGKYGFIAEISALPSSPDTTPADEIVIRQSRIDNNDRGAIDYQNTGEVPPSISIEDCSMSYNGIHLYGNVSTSSQAVQLQLHNTMMLLFRGNSLAHNRGGLFVSATSSSAVARLSAVIKGNLFSWNSNSTTLAFLGNNYQMVAMLNNIISMNYALYHDTVLIKDMSVNMTKNVFLNNTGLNTVDMHGYSRITSESQTFLYNSFKDNLALGHGHQYQEKYGFHPKNDLQEFDYRPRKKRQVAVSYITQQGVSFDWWTHVDNDTGRYRSTILAGSTNQVYHYNIFDDPRNDYELTTTRQTQLDLGSIDARMNYWGYPGTDGVAAGKIRDFNDYAYLNKVEYVPVLESNTSLIEGDCPGGWFQVGMNEFKSCYLFVGAVATYAKATTYCEELDAFIPYMRADDDRQKKIANRIEAFSQQYVTDAERFNTLGMVSDVHIWIGAASIPSNQCGWLSAKTAKIGAVNCNSLMAFVCEKGTQPYVEPIMWRKSMVIVFVILGILAALLFLLICCWVWKSHRRKDEVIERHNLFRASLKLKQDSERHEKRRAAIGMGSSMGSHTSTHASLPASTINAYGEPFVKNRAPVRTTTTTATSARSPTETLRTSCSDSLSTDHTYEKTYSSDTGRDNTKTTYSTSYTTIRTGDYTSNYQSGRYQNKRSPPSSTYAEIPQLNTFQSPNKSPRRPNGVGGVKMRNAENSYDSSTVTPTTDTSGTTPTCSTCTGSELDSTLTSGTWSERSSVASDSTIQGRRPPKGRPEPPSRAPPPQPSSDYFRGSGRHFDQPQRSQTNLAETGRNQPTRAAPAPPGTIGRSGGTMGRESGGTLGRDSGGAIGRESGGTIGRDAGRAFPDSAGTFGRSAATPNAPPTTSAPSRSLVDLYNPYLPRAPTERRNSEDAQRYSSRKPLVETAM